MSTRCFASAFGSGRTRPLRAVFIITALVVVALVSCFGGHPDQPDGEPGKSITVYPDSGGQLVSDDERVLVTFEPGTVSHPTTFSIVRIPRDNYPDQILLQSDVYQIEPSRTLNKTVKITFDLNGLSGHGFTLSQLYTQDALALRELLPAKPAAFIASEETTVEDLRGSPHRVLKTEIDRLGALGAFVHDCYVMCRKSVECATWPRDPNLTIKQQIARCMDDNACPGDIEAMNSPRLQERFSCALRRSCRDAFGCCLEDPPCGGQTDGDTPVDGDQPTDGDTPVDGDQTTDGDTPTDGDTEPDGDGGGDGDEDIILDFSPRTCTKPDDCFNDPCLTVQPDRHFCLSMSENPVRLYTSSSPGVWTEVPDNPMPITDCAGDPPAAGTVGDYIFNLRVTLDTWWQVSSPEGIQVFISLENNPTTPFLQGNMDAAGKVDFNNVELTDEWFVVRVSRDSETPAQRIVPTWHWGNFVTNEEARGANLNSEKIVLKVMPVDGNRYVQFAQSLGIVVGVPAGHGMVLGQVTDCRINPPYVVAHASVGFMELAPLVMGYFDDQANYPMPDSSRVGTNKNGLFAAIYMPPADVLTAFAFGTVRFGATDSIDLLGLTIEGHLKLSADSVSIVRFNRFR